MGQKLKSLSGMLIIAVASATLASVKPAQAETVRLHPIADDFNRQFFEASGDFYYNVSLPGYLGDYLGIASPSGVVAFPDKEIERDASPPRWPLPKNHAAASFQRSNSPQPGCYKSLRFISNGHAERLSASTST
jgi:hypothetical protein